MRRNYYSVAIVTHSDSDKDDNTEHIEDKAADKFNYEVGVTSYCRNVDDAIYNF